MSEMALAKPVDLFAYFESVKFKAKLTAAIPNAMRADRVIQLALTMIKGSPSLMRCSPISLMSCVVECAQLGLELDRILGHAYIVPFQGEATLIVGYRGFCHLMYQSGAVQGISAEVVRARDRFQYAFGTKRSITHVPMGIPKDDDCETWRGAYAVAHTLTGVEFEYMEAAKIIATRNRSKSWQAWIKDGKKTPWQTDTEEMWRKTPIRRLAKRMPVSTTDRRDTLLRAVMIDEYGERKGLLKPTEEGFQISDEAVAEPIEPTQEISTNEEFSAKLQESIEIVDAGKKGGKPGREKKKPPKSTEKVQQVPVQELKVDTSALYAGGVPKANIPPPVKLDDAFLTVKQQTEIFHVAAQAGWKIPEEISSMLTRHFKCKSLREVRNSQFLAVMQKVKSGT